MTLSYVWQRFWKKLPGTAIQNCHFERPSAIEANSTVIKTSVGRYSYCGYNCTLINCRIGRFCSISDYVSAGLANHPIDWVSTSPAFYRGIDSIPKDLAALDYDPAGPETVIGNDVWIGQNTQIKSGIVIGNGAVIGMGSVVTHDVPAYAVVAGNPARVIRMRFEAELVQRLEQSQWWDMPLEELKRFSHLMNNPKVFLRELEEHH